MWCIHKVGFFSDTKKTEVMTLGTWMDIEIIMLNEISHIQKTFADIRDGEAFGFAGFPRAVLVI